jgi:hypothetical protein
MRSVGEKLPVTVVDVPTVTDSQNVHCILFAFPVSDNTIVSDPTLVHVLSGEPSQIAVGLQFTEGIFYSLALILVETR